MVSTPDPMTAPQEPAGRGVAGIDTGGHPGFVHRAAALMLRWRTEMVPGRSTHESDRHPRVGGGCVGEGAPDPLLASTQPGAGGLPVPGSTAVYSGVEPALGAARRQGWAM